MCPLTRRGSTCLLPDATMEAYERAIADGADFVGIDVVSTSDGVLICRPDITLDDNTNVASLSQFSGRKSMQVGARTPPVKP